LSPRNYISITDRYKISYSIQSNPLRPTPLQSIPLHNASFLFLAYPLIGGLTCKLQAYLTCMELISRLASKGLIHCDFNEFNLLINEDEEVRMWLCTLAFNLLDNKEGEEYACLHFILSSMVILQKQSFPFLIRPACSMWFGSGDGQAISAALKKSS